jgi:sugar phosphate isomerase/epimerase
VAEPPANLIHRGIGRVEVFDFAPDRLPALQRVLSEKGLPFSIHAPLTRPLNSDYPAVAVFFLSEDSRRRELSLAMLGQTVLDAGAWGAEYVVTHLNWADDTDDEAEAVRLAEESAERLSAMAQEMPVHIECGGYTGAFHQPRQFVELVSAHPSLGLCVDIGHLWLIAQARGRDFYRDLEVLAPAARSVHLWNARDMATYRRCHHVPLHPSQRPEDGWIDIPRALGILLEVSPGCRLIFEYREDGLPPARMQEGFAWVEELASEVHLGNDERRESRQDE